MDAKTQATGEVIQRVRNKKLIVKRLEVMCKLYNRAICGGRAQKTEIYGHELYRMVLPDLKVHPEDKALKEYAVTRASVARGQEVFRRLNEQAPLARSVYDYLQSVHDKNILNSDDQNDLRGWLECRADTLPQRQQVTTHITSKGPTGVL